MHEKTLNNLPPLSEATIQELIVDLLSKVARPLNFFFFSVPNERRLSDQTSNKKFGRLAKLKRMGMVPGAADLVLVHNGHACFIEVKNRNGTMTKNQQQFRQTALDHGCGHILARDPGDVVEGLKGLGIWPRSKNEQLSPWRD